MRIIPQSYSIEYMPPNEIMMRDLERWARTAYKTEEKAKAGDLIHDILNRKPPHMSVIRHYMLVVKFVTNRGVTHEIVRHQAGINYTQESTRYCNYAKGRFGNQLTFIEPLIPAGTVDYEDWWEAMQHAEQKYLKMIANGVKPQVARGVLPQDIKSEIVVSANLQAWRYVFSMRTHPDAHPQMIQLMTPLYFDLLNRYPMIFDTLPETVSAPPSWLP